MIEYQLLIAVFLGIAVLLLLILKGKLQAFLALLIASITVGVVAGLDGDQIIKSIQNGMGSTLGFVATIVGLGALFGSILEYSGGAKVLASSLIEKMGQQKSSVALVLSGFLVAIPVFFDVAFIILVPLVYALQKRTGKSLLTFAMPLLAGLGVTHVFVPPTPGPVAVADILGANLGWVIIFGLMVGIPTALITGLWFGKYISKKIFLPVPEYMQVEDKDVENPPSLGAMLAIIAFPIALMVFSTALDYIASDEIKQTLVMQVIHFIGHPFTALILANLLAWYYLGTRRGVTSATLSEVTTKSLAPAGLIILLTGAGGVLKQILIDTGVGDMLSEYLAQMTSSPYIVAYIVAVGVRVLQGSATVAMITAAGITAPLVAGLNLGEVQLALLVLAIAAGSTILSHVNDSGFWLVNRYLGMDEKQTFRSWSMMTLLISLIGITIVLMLSLVI